MFKIYILALLILTYMKGPLPKYVEKNGMSFSWKIEGDYMHCEVRSPGKGWVAVGFNTKQEITKSNLIMGAAEHGHFKMSDRYVVSFGNHKSVLSLGGNEAILDRNVIENEKGSIMTFKIKVKSEDTYHYNLIQGEEIFLWMAYSREDDFEHHSAMRTSIKITL